MITEEEMKEILRAKDGRLFHREGQSLEFKEQYNFAGLAEYFRDFAAFSNNKGGLLIFGVTDAPRVATGLSENSLEAFEKIDPERISGYLLEIFSSNITWEQVVFDFDGKHFGVFKISEAEIKPVIARKDEGRDQIIKNGDVYFRYGGRTQKIQAAELEGIINRRIEQTNRDWIDHVRSIGTEGPRSAIVLKSESSLTRAKGAPLVVDEELARKLKFIKEGQFEERTGATTLKVVGDVVSVDTVAIEKVVKENLFRTYPFTAMELAIAVKNQIPSVGQSKIWRAISENKMKGDSSYSAYNFRSKKEEDQFSETRIVPSTTPVLYNQEAINLLVKLFKQEGDTLSS